VITVSHDEAYVNAILGYTPLPNTTTTTTAAAAGIDLTAENTVNTSTLAIAREIYVLSKKTLRKFEGTFQEYKQLVLKKVTMTTDT
jgi:hypothetical protein